MKRSVEDKNLGPLGPKGPTPSACARLPGSGHSCHAVQQTGAPCLSWWLSVLEWGHPLHAAQVMHKPACTYSVCNIRKACRVT